MSHTRKKRFSDRFLRFARLSLAGWLMLAQSHAIAQHLHGTRKPAGSPISRTGSDLKLGQPIDCTLGKDCHILAYMDQEPGPEFRDFGGGRQTYDGHDGTDFGIADEAAMKKGVAVKAAASGIVARVRDGVADKRIENPRQAEAVGNIGCGNAVVIDHPNEWRTYYCHLRNGSLAVRPGMRVEKGAVLGMVGSSGLASYPHLHLGVLRQGKKIDPFLGPPPPEGGQMESQPLWEEAISYVPTGLINAGFSSQKADISAVWQGALSATSLTTTAPAIIFWVHPFGVIAGDIEQLRLIAPDGKTIIERNAEIKSPNRINRVSSIGKRNTPENPLSAGTWQGQYQLRRNEKLLIDIKREIQMRKT